MLIETVMLKLTETLLLVYFGILFFHFLVLEVHLFFLTEDHLQLSSTFQISIEAPVLCLIA